MAYVYLLDLNKFVEQRLAATKEALEELNGGPSEEKFIDGRTSVLKDFQDFLLQNYIPKLPRRIRETYRFRRASGPG
jgi:hypothetical protein